MLTLTLKTAAVPSSWLALWMLEEAYQWQHSASAWPVDLLLYKRFKGARKLYPSVNHNLVRCKLALWQNPIYAVKIKQEGYRWDQTTASNCWIKAPAGWFLVQTASIRSAIAEASNTIYQTNKIAVGKPGRRPCTVCMTIERRLTRLY